MGYQFHWSYSKTVHGLLWPIKCFLCVFKRFSASNRCLVWIHLSCVYFCLISTCLTRVAQTHLVYWALSQRSPVADWIFWPLSLRSLKSPRSPWRSTCHPRPRSKVAGHTAATAAVIQVSIPQRAQAWGRANLEKPRLKNSKWRYELMSWTKECKMWASNLAWNENSLELAFMFLISSHLLPAET